MAVGSHTDVTTHTECGTYPSPEATNTDAKHVVPCRDVGRYVSIMRSGGQELYDMTLCEVIIIGYVYNGDESTGR